MKRYILYSIEFGTSNYNLGKGISSIRFIYPSVIHPSSVHASTHPSSYLSIYPPSNLSTYPSTWPSILGGLELVKVKFAQSCPTLYSPWNSPGQNTGVGSLSLLQGIFQPRDRTIHLVINFGRTWTGWHINSIRLCSDLIIFRKWVD